MEQRVIVITASMKSHNRKKRFVINRIALSRYWRT